MQCDGDHSFRREIQEKCPLNPKELAEIPKTTESAPTPRNSPVQSVEILCYLWKSGGGFVRGGQPTTREISPRPRDREGGAGGLCPPPLRSSALPSGRAIGDLRGGSNFRRQPNALRAAKSRMFDSTNACRQKRPEESFFAYMQPFRACISMHVAVGFEAASALEGGGCAARAKSASVDAEANAVLTKGQNKRQSGCGLTPGAWTKDPGPENRVNVRC